MDIESSQVRGVLKPYARQISSSSSRYSEKKLRKRKELDAMLIVRHHKSQRKSPPSTHTHRRHELLRDVCSDEATTSSGCTSSGGEEDSGFFRRERKTTGGSDRKGVVTWWRKNCLHGLCLAMTLLASLFAIITVIWLHLQMNITVDRFRSQLDSVIEERKLANDNHHRYHTQIQELMANQSLLTNNITLLYQLYHNYSSQMTKLDSSVSTLMKSLQSAPELKTLPQDMVDAKKNLAKFGSHLTNLDTRVSELENKLSHNVVEMANTLNRSLSKRNEDTYDSILRKVLQEKVQPLQEDIKHLDEYRRIFARNITEQLKTQEINFAQNLKIMNNLEDNMRNVTQANRMHEDHLRRINERLQKVDDGKKSP